MSTLFETTIRPGDVIGSDLFAQLLLKLEELDTRVGALESDTSEETGSVRLLSFDPPVQQRVGQLLEIAGVNLMIPLSGNTLTIDDQPVTEFLDGSTSELLRVIIPSTVSVPDTGANVTVRVTNSNGTSALLYHLLPEIEVPGDPPSFVSAGVVNDSGGVQPLLINDFCRINGENLAADPTDNVITFTVTTGTGTVVYPAAGEELEIDPAESSETLIRVRVPDITEVALGQVSTVTLEITVGAHPPASANVTVIRGS